MHKLVRVKLRLDLCCSRHRTTRRPPPVAFWKFAGTVLREDFPRRCLRGFRTLIALILVVQSLQCLCGISFAIEVVGFCGRRKLDWLLENEQALSPLLANKKHVWDQVLSVGSPYTHRRFRQREHAVKRAVADAKERWVKKTAEAANVDRDGCGRWKFLKKSFRIFTMVGSQLRFLV